MLEALGNLGDFIGGIAVVVTLIYLAFQIRQNTSALETASRQAISEGYRESNRLRLDPGVGEAWVRGLASFPDLPFTDCHRFSTILVDEALFFQSVFTLRAAGQLDDITYEAYLTWFASVVATPGGTVWWETTGRPIYTADMVAAVDERLANGGLHKLDELPGFQLGPDPDGLR
jgi:hypothetical protein